MKRFIWAGFLVPAMLAGPTASADSYNPASNTLTIASVQVGGTVYTNVAVTAGAILAVGGSHVAPVSGEPSAGYDNYDGATNRLAIPSVQLGTTMYTDVAINVGNVLSVGGSHAAALAADPNPGGQTWRMGGVALGQFKSTLPAGDGSLIQSEVVAMPDGTYRMYVGGRRQGSAGGDIWMAQSTDGAATWHLVGMAVAGSLDPQNPEFQIAGPSIVHLPDGRWRMYYQATPDFDVTLSGGTKPSFQMFSAISPDGLTWTKEGVRIPNYDFDATSVMKRVGHGRVLPLASGGYVAFASANPKGQTNPNGIYRFFSSDGLTFTNTTDLVLADGHDPYIVYTGGQFLMYADTSPNTSDGTTPFGVLMRSPDAITWTAPQSVAFVGIEGEPLHLGGATPTVSIGDFSGVMLSNGKLRLFSNYCCNNIGYFDLAVIQ